MLVSGGKAELVACVLHLRSCWATLTESEGNDSTSHSLDDLVDDSEDDAQRKQLGNGRLCRTEIRGTVCPATVVKCVFEAQNKS